MSLSPARIKTIILPVGKIRKSRFREIVTLLTPVCEVRLGDVTPDPRPDRSTFSPLAAPGGYVLYDFTIHDVSNSLLSPFEVWREPLAIIGIADGEEYDANSGSSADMVMSTILNIEEEYPRVLVRKVLVFGQKSSQNASPVYAQDTIFIPTLDQRKTATLRTVMCDITSHLLAEMTTFAASIKALPSIASPSGTGGSFYAQSSNDQSSALSRSNSPVGQSPRSSSPATNTARMSMPVFPSSNSAFDGATENSRPASPNTGHGSVPARTFEEIVNGGGSVAGNLKATPSTSRDNSRDRVSISGFGPGSIDERNRHKGKCRVSIVVSSLYILAGRWNDALESLADTASLARNFGDYIWHAKALENMMISMILLAWSGAAFKIPPICYPAMDRTASKLAQVTSPTSSDMPNGANTAGQTALRKELASVLPEMTHMIIGYYNRAANSGGDYLPQLAFSECIIRLSKILSSLHLGGGTLTNATLDHMIRGMDLSGNLSVGMHTRITVLPSRASVTDILMRAMPGPAEFSGLSAIEEATILAGMASVLSTLGLHRKKSMILKNYLEVVVRALEEARTVGAAQAGIHPSSNGFAQSISAFPENHDAGGGLDEFLDILCQVYGIPESTWSRSENLKGTLPNGKVADRDPITPAPERLIANFLLRFFGSVNVKSDVLRVCIQLCEALPDPRGILHWTSALLRTAGPGIAPSADSSDVLVTLSREEQLQLASNIAKTISDAKAVGLENIEAEYWDEFLVRGVYTVPSSSSLLLHAHKKSDLLATDPQKAVKKGPFIHNPFLDKSETKSTSNFIVAGDEREYVVSLQNPYDFEVHIESISFSAGEEIFGRSQNLILRPYRTQSFSVPGTINATGEFDLDRCIIKIRGCKERAFPIFGQSWTPEQDSKIKSIGLLKSPSTEDNRESKVSASLDLTKRFPKSSTVSLTIIPPQPVLEITSVSLSQSSAMLLEGERVSFKATVKNVSFTVAADFVHMSFHDSTATAIQEALLNKKLNSSELFELEHQLSHNQAIQLVGEKSSTIGPGQSCDFAFEILGKPGLTSATVHIDYTNLSSSHTDDQNKFYTRQVSLPIAITVNASIQLHRIDVLPVSEDFVARGLVNSEHEHCLLMLDLRNAWPVPLEITLDISNNAVQGQQPFFNTHEVVQPGHVSRMIMFLPKIYIKNPHARIRSANERQFVVSANNMSPEPERVARELFWYREALLKDLKATWKQEGGTKHGTIDLRSILRLTPRMVDALKIDDVEITMHVGEDPSARNTIKVDEQAVFTTRITNRCGATIYPLLRLRPSLSHQPAEVALDIGKRLAWSGLLQRILTPLGPGESTEVTMAICALCAGDYEFGATIEEIKPCNRVEEKAGDDSMPDLVAGTLGRRSWIAGKPYKIIAVD